MKKLLIFIALLCTAAVASNEPAIIIVSGPSYIAASSYGVKYHIGVGGHLNGDHRGYNWEVRDENDNQVNDWIVSRHDEQNARINIISNCTIYATLYYEEWDTGINKSLHTSYAVTTGTPTFYLHHADSIHNGQFDTTVTGVTTRVIHFNIDNDDHGPGHGQYTPDYQIDGQKYLSDDDDILTFQINSSSGPMNVEYIKLDFESSHLRVCRIDKYSSNICVPITTNGITTTVYCGNNNDRGRIFNRNLYLEGRRTGLGSLKIKYRLENGDSTTIAELRYRTCADKAGRQEMFSGDQSVFTQARSLLTGCEFSIFDSYNMSNIMPPFFPTNNNFNAPALAVDNAWDIIGTPFKVAIEGPGTPNNPFWFNSTENCWYTSYEAFGGATAFYESTLWEPKLFGNVPLSYARVINYCELATALRSFHEPGICPGWKMFYMKLTGLTDWPGNTILHHRGEVLYQHYYNQYSLGISSWQPKIYGLELP